MKHLGSIAIGWEEADDCGLALSDHSRQALVLGDEAGYQDVSLLEITHAAVCLSDVLGLDRQHVDYFLLVHGSFELRVLLLQSVCASCLGLELCGQCRELGFHCV